MNQSPNLERVKSDAISADLYQQRRPGKHRAEMALVVKAYRLLPQDLQTALDAPCGVGRFSLWLCEQGLEVTAIDLGEAALQRCQKLLVEFSDRSRVAKQNIFNLEFNDRDFDLTLCFRLLHHFEDRTTQVQLVRELCRVTDRYVMISYFSTYSVTALRRRLRKFFRNKPVKQNPTPLNELVRMFTDQGFVLKKKIKRSGFVHSLQLAVFERIQTS